MKRLAALLPLLMLAILAPAQEAADSPVEVKIEIFLVSEVQGQEQFKRATTARPGQVVEYRITATNRSDETLPGGTVEILGPIPDGTTFVPNSATPSTDRILTEFSADGGNNFSKEPVLIGNETDRRVADPDSYDVVRWTLLVPMEPGQEEAFFYRVTVD